MTRQEIFDKLKEILIRMEVKDQATIENCTEDTDLISDFGFSSVNMLYIVIVIEETFNIRFENVGVSDMKVVRDVITYIEGELNK